MEPAAYLAEYEKAVKDMETLPAPSGWSNLKSATVRELNRRLTMMRFGSMPPIQVLRAADDQWLEIEQVFRDLMNAKAGFWTGWPHLRR